MAQHYPSNTVSDSRWCNKCKRFTQHAVSGHKIGHCLACLERQSNKQNYRAYFQAPVTEVPVTVSCTCSLRPFPHVHSAQELMRFKRALPPGNEERA